MRWRLRDYSKVVRFLEFIDDWKKLSRSACSVSESSLGEVGEVSGRHEITRPFSPPLKPLATTRFLIHSASTKVASCHYPFLVVLLEDCAAKTNDGFPIREDPNHIEASPEFALTSVSHADGNDQCHPLNSSRLLEP